MTHRLTLVSHMLCPYVQRAAIVLAEKGVAFDRIDVDLSNKPDWFLRISPLGKTPVLLVDDEPIFESAVICEYLDDTTLPRLHPENALQRARHRAWMEFGSAVLNTIAGFYNAADDDALQAKAAELRRQFGRSRWHWVRDRTSPAPSSRSSMPCSARSSATSMSSTA